MIIPRQVAKQVEKASLECDNIYILGDHNIDTSRWNEKGYYLKRIAEEYQSMMGKNGLEMIDFGITWQRIQENGVIKRSALDHTLTNNISSIINHKKLDITYSDHSAIFIDIQAWKQKVKNQQRISRDMRKLRANPGRFRQGLEKIDWTPILFSIE